MCSRKALGGYSGSFRDRGTRGRNHLRGPCLKITEYIYMFSCDFFSIFLRREALSRLSGMIGQAAQPVPLASLKLSMAVYGRKLDERPPDERSNQSAVLRKGP